MSRTVNNSPASGTRRRSATTSAPDHIVDDTARLAELRREFVRSPKDHDAFIRMLSVYAVANANLGPADGVAKLVAAVTAAALATADISPVARAIAIGGLETIAFFELLTIDHQLKTAHNDDVPGTALARNRVARRAIYRRYGDIGVLDAFPSRPAIQLLAELVLGPGAAAGLAGALLGDVTWNVMDAIKRHRLIPRFIDGELIRVLAQDALDSSSPERKGLTFEEMSSRTGVSLKEWWHTMFGEGPEKRYHWQTRADVARATSLLFRDILLAREQAFVDLAFHPFRKDSNVRPGRPLARRQSPELHAPKSRAEWISFPKDVTLWAQAQRHALTRLLALYPSSRRDVRFNENESSTNYDLETVLEMSFFRGGQHVLRRDLLSAIRATEALLRTGDKLDRERLLRRADRFPVLLNNQLPFRQLLIEAMGEDRFQARFPDMKLDGLDEAILVVGCALQRNAVNNVACVSVADITKALRSNWDSWSNALDIRGSIDERRVARHLRDMEDFGNLTHELRYRKPRHRRPDMKRDIQRDVPDLLNSEWLFSKAAHIIAERRGDARQWPPQPRVEDSLAYLMELYPSSAASRNAPDEFDEAILAVGRSLQRNALNNVACVSVKDITTRLQALRNSRNTELEFSGPIDARRVAERLKALESRDGLASRLEFGKLRDLDDENSEWVFPSPPRRFAARDAPSEPWGLELTARMEDLPAR